MKTLNLYLSTVWDDIVESVKTAVATFEDANFDSSLERCRNTWECYADLVWQRAPFGSMFESEIVEPACSRAVGKISEFRVTVLLAWLWREYLEEYDPGVKYPWQMVEGAQRSALSDCLFIEMRKQAMSDGAEIEERSMFGE